MEIMACQLHVTELIGFVVIYKKTPFMSLEAKEQLWKEYFKYFPGQQVVLLLAEETQEPTYYGRQDLIDWMIRENCKLEFKGVHECLST